MYGNQFAKTFSHGDLSSTLTVAASGETIYVYGIAIASIAGGLAVIEQTDGTEIAHVRVTATSTVVIDIPFLADKGLIIRMETPPAADDSWATAFHSQTGA
jgi:hypothetical protein